MKDLIVREAGERDVYTCARIIMSAFNMICADYGFNADKSADAIVSRLNQGLTKNNHIYLAEADGEPVGTFMLEKSDEEIYEISKISVMPEKQRKGYAQAMLDWATEKALRMGAVSLVCALPATNATARSWLEKNGFIEEVSATFEGMTCPICILQKDMKNPYVKPMPTTPEICDSGCGDSGCSSCSSCSSCSASEGCDKAEKTI